jgi:hypothetical protein
MVLINNVYLIGFEVLTAVSTKMAVFWVVAPCSVVEVYQRSRGPCCLHHQGDECILNVIQILKWTTLYFTPLHTLLVC